MNTVATVSRSLLTACTVVAVAASGVGVASAQSTQSTAKSRSNTPVAMEGYCAVCIIEARKWEKGDPQITSTFDGFEYHFPSAAIKAKFDRSPERYVPVLNGDCIVCLEKAGKRVPGNIRHASIHQGRLYLFPSEKEKQMFAQAPDAYAKTDIGANGECIVCLVKAKKHVAGSTDHTVFHNGMRYLFPSDREAGMFRANPQEFVSAGMKAKTSGNSQTMIKTPARETVTTAVTVSGRSGCAACEFGVTPIAAPDELGLAIVAQDGRVTVIENAHKDYPEIYKNRFKSQQLVASGQVLRQQGRITWLKPTSLQQAR